MQIEIFSRVKDPRVPGKGEHELEDVLRIVLIGVLCSCDDYDEISDLIEDRADEFRAMGFLKLANGVPSGDTIRRVVESADPDQMRASLSVCRDRIEKGHGRQEKRTCSILDTRQLEQEGLYEEWPGLKRINRIDRERICEGSKTNDTSIISVVRRAILSTKLDLCQYSIGQQA